MAMIVLSAIVLLAGCPSRDQRGPTQAAQNAPTAPAALATTTAPASVSWKKKGVELRYSSDWKSINDPDYELALIPAGATGKKRRITVDVPDLPPHFAWMIQMGRVEHDYLADLKKEHPDLKVVESSDAKVPDSTARLVRSTWHEGQQSQHDVVLLIIHAGAVYILDAQTDEPHLAETRAAFDAIRASLKWTK